VEESGARNCIYGHLHTQLDWERTFQGEFRGVNYRLVSCDFLDFKPLLIEEF
jgi:predicted phosphohydrolase